MSSRNERLSMRLTALAAGVVSQVARVSRKAFLTEVFVLDVSSRFLFGLDNVHGLLGEVANEHLLQTSDGSKSLEECGCTAAIVMANEALAETAPISSSIARIFLIRATRNTSARAGKQKA